ncbi:MAG: hypothetical protein GY913_05245 [Proteobacteria bacterium]|nr:hypothetical protein [Pseudomonadota bacterium]MCP4916307.1 hypothetical protein [Pseudomonadota bacterium]
MGSLLDKLPKYRGAVPSQAALQQRRDGIHKRHKQALAKVDELVRTQAELGKALNGELKTLETHEIHLRELERQEADDSIWASLVQRFSARSAILGRKSVAEGLLRQYEVASTRLRQATAFSDELRLTALELQEQVDLLHDARVESKDNERTAARRVIDVERALGALEKGEHNFTAEEAARRIDQLTFTLRSESLNLELFRAAADLAKDSLSPTRALRDAVLELHEGMSGYVMNASGAVDSAGRRIQALGMAADAPTVVAELQESLTELGTAMEVTAAYVEETQRLLTDVLPDLSARIANEVESRNLLLTDRLDVVSRERAKALADKALRNAAQAEVDGWLDDEG